MDEERHTNPIDIFASLDRKPGKRGLIGYPIIIHPADYLNKDAFIDRCGMIDNITLNELKDRILNFYKSFKKSSFDELDERIIK